jgi:hypothetical protein
MNIQDLIEKYERLYEAVDGLSGVENMVSIFLDDLQKLESKNSKLPIPHVRCKRSHPTPTPIGYLFCNHFTNFNKS